MATKASDIEKAYDIPIRRVQYFVTNGLVGYESNPGRGSVGRTFSKLHVFQILVANELYDKCGMELRAVKDIMGRMEEEGFMNQNFMEATQFSMHYLLIAMIGRDKEGQGEMVMSLKHHVEMAEEMPTYKIQAELEQGAMTTVILNLSELCHHAI